MLYHQCDQRHTSGEISESLVQSATPPSVMGVQVIARTLMLLLIATTAALCAPSVGPHGRWGDSDEQDAERQQPSQSRVTRQAPGSDILTRLSEAFKDKMQQKCGGAPSGNLLPNLVRMLSDMGVNLDLPHGIANMAKDVAAEYDEQENPPAE